MLAEQQQHVLQAVCELCIVWSRDKLGNNFVFCNRTFLFPFRENILLLVSHQITASHRHRLARSTSYSVNRVKQVNISVKPLAAGGIQP